MYSVNNDKLTLYSDNRGEEYVAVIGNTRFYSDNTKKCCYIDKKGEKHYLSELDCKFSETEENGEIGFKYEYNDFILIISIKTQSLGINFELIPKVECDYIKEFFWPAPVKREYSADGYAVLPIMQGMMIEDSEQTKAYNIFDGLYSRREYTMPWWGQSSIAGSYMALVETPYDSRYIYEHNAGESTSVRICWISSLGSLRYSRKLSLALFEQKKTYVDFAKLYRKLLEEQNKIVTLADKVKKNPKMKEMIGRSVLTPSLAHYKIEPESSYYNADDPSKNTHTNSFESIAAELEKCYDKGVRDAYVHLDGWGLGGYDNKCPRVYPVNPEAGGDDGLKLIKDTCKKLNYILAYHDQYRDYYVKSPDYDENKAVMHEDGTVLSTEDIVWYGGIEAQLCATQALPFIERNYKQLDAAGLKPDGVYIDVFSASILDECLNPEHPMSREDCAAERKKCFEYIRKNDMIISSEELIGEFADALDLVHHSPYVHAFFPHLKREPFGVHIPLINLVFHDCVLIPWAMGRDVWGLPDGESGFLNCLLNGNIASTMTFSPDSVFVNAKLTEKLSREVAFDELVSHEFIEGRNKQKSVFSGGTTVEIDTKADTYRICWRDGSVTEGNV